MPITLHVESSIFETLSL